MSGVKVGTRLDQLLALRNRLDHEIAVERRKAALADRRWQLYRKPRQNKPNRPGDNGQAQESADTTRMVLDRLGVTSLAVKEWGVREGYLVKVARGRVSLWLVHKYAEAHGKGDIC